MNGSELKGYWADHMTLPFDHTHGLDLGVSKSESEIALSQEWGDRLTGNEKDVSHTFMTMILTSMTMVGWADVPGSDQGDFRRRRAVEISSYDMWDEITYPFLNFNGFKALRWRHNGLDSVSSHQPHDCLLNRSFGRRSKKTSKLRVTGLCVGNSTVTSNAENVSIWWRHHGLLVAAPNASDENRPVHIPVRNKSFITSIWTVCIKTLWPSHAILVNIGPGNSLVPGGIKLLPDTVLINQPSMRSSVIHLTFSQQMSKMSLLDMSLKITWIKFIIIGANESTLFVERRVPYRVLFWLIGR